MSTEARLSVLEMMMAEAFARLFTSDDEMRSWTERTAEQVRRQAEAREKNNPAISAAYSQAWDAMLASVRAQRAFRHAPPPG